jgi:hypothetical protein
MAIDLKLEAAARAADDAFQAELVRVYGEKGAGDARYRVGRYDDAALQAAVERKYAADRAWLAEMDRARRAAEAQVHRCQTVECCEPEDSGPLAQCYGCGEYALTEDAAEKFVDVTVDTSSPETGPRAQDFADVQLCPTCAVDPLAALDFARARRDEEV